MSSTDVYDRFAKTYEVEILSRRIERLEEARSESRDELWGIRRDYIDKSRLKFEMTNYCFWISYAMVIVLAVAIFALVSGLVALNKVKELSESREESAVAALEWESTG